VETTENMYNKSTMKRNIISKKISNDINKLLKEQPKIKEALRVFDISYKQYQHTMEGSHVYYNDVSTLPHKYNCKTR